MRRLWVGLGGAVVLIVLLDIADFDRRYQAYPAVDRQGILRQVQDMQKELVAVQDEVTEMEAIKAQLHMQPPDVSPEQIPRQDNLLALQQRDGASLQPHRSQQSRPRPEPPFRSIPQKNPVKVEQRSQLIKTVQQHLQEPGYTDHNSMRLHTGEDKSSYPPKPKDKQKGNARQDLLFNMKDACDPKKDYMPPGQLCQGVGPNQQPPGSCPDNRVEKGSFDALPRVGGPTGCHQAWITVQGDDSFLAATLVLLHTIRKYTQQDRDFVVIASTAVSQPVLDILLAECVRVIQVDPFDGNELAKQLVAKSERYKSGYWLLKMYVWRAMEYSKLVFLDGDIYFRHNPDPLFCAPTPPKKAPIAVTPRSSFNAGAGFNAGMFVFNPSRDTFQGILKKFVSLTEQEMLATSEQDFLNDFFKGRYNLVPIDFVCKHRRMVNEGPKKWDLQRVMGYHMNGNPKPWNPTWRTQCAYPDEHAAKWAKYVDFFREWWAYYYDMIGERVPYDVSQYRLKPEHDLYKVRWATWDPKAFKCPAPFKGLSNKGRRL